MWGGPLARPVPDLPCATVVSMPGSRWILSIVLLVRAAAPADPAPLRFAILGDRTGSVQPGVYEQVWREVAAAKPEFVVTVGDLIEGSNDASADQEWRAVEKILQPYRGIP